MAKLWHTLNGCVSVGGSRCKHFKWPQYRATGEEVALILPHSIISTILSRHVRFVTPGCEFSIGSIGRDQHWWAVYLNITTSLYFEIVWRTKRTKKWQNNIEWALLKVQIVDAIKIAGSRFNKGARSSLSNNKAEVSPRWSSNVAEGAPLSAQKNKKEVRCLVHNRRRSHVCGCNAVMSCYPGIWTECFPPSSWSHLNLTS